MLYRNNTQLRNWLEGRIDPSHKANFDAEVFEFDDQEFERSIAQVESQYHNMSPHQVRLRAAYHLLSNPSTSGIFRVEPLPKQVGQAKGHPLRTRVFLILKIAWAILLLAGVWVVAAKAQTPIHNVVSSDAIRASAIRRGIWAVPPPAGIVVQVQNQGTTLATRGGGLIVLNCTTNMSCSFSGSTFTITSSATAGTAWSSLTAPAANQAMLHGANTTLFTYNAATGAGVNLFTITDTASNTGTGILFRSTLASGSAALPFQADANGIGWRVNTAGNLFPVSTATLAIPGTARGVVVSEGAATAIATTAAGTAGQVLLSNGPAADPSFGDPNISYNQVLLLNAVGASGTQTSAATTLSTRTAVGTLNVVGTGITGSPVGCTIAYELSLAGTATAVVQSFAFTPANSYQNFQTVPSGANTAADQMIAVYTCTTYPTAGTLTVSFSPASASSLVNISQWGGTSTTLGQKLMASSLPVAIASDQSGVPVNQGTGSTLANAWSVRLTDGTNGPAAVKAASTAAVAADPSAVVALSPNSPLPSGGNVIGSLGANQSVNIGQWGAIGTSLGQKQGINSVPVVPASDFLPSDTVGTTTALNTANAVASITVTGQQGAGMYIFSGGTLQGTVVPEVSYNGAGGPFVASFFYNPTTGALSTSLVVNSPPDTYLTILTPAGTSHARVRVSSFTSGASNAVLRATFTSPSLLPILNSNPAGTEFAVVTRNIASGTQTITGNVNATQSGVFTVQPGNTQNTTPWETTITDNVTPANKATVNASGQLTVNCAAGCAASAPADVTASGTLSLAGNAVQIAMAGVNSASFSLPSGNNLVGVITPESSTDGGTTWAATLARQQGATANFWQSTISVSSTNAMWDILVPGGSSHVRVRLSTATSGSATVSLRATQQPESVLAQVGVVGQAAPTYAAQVAGSDGTNLRSLSVDTAGRLNVLGTKSTNAGVPGATNLGTLPCLANAAAPTLTEGNQIALSCDLSGNIRVVVPGTVAVTQSGIWTVQPGNTQNTTPWLVQGNLSNNGAAAGTNRVATLDGIARTDYAGGTALTAGNNAAPDVGTEGLLHVAALPAIRPASYSASATVTAAATPSDTHVLPGNATNTVLVTRLKVSCTQTTAGIVTLNIIKRSTADSAGTSTATTVVPDDSNFAAGSSAPLSYTANPTLGTAVGNVDTYKIGCMAAGTATPNDIFILNRTQKPIVLRGTAQQLAVNWGGATIAGLSVSVTYEWMELTTISP